MKFKIHHIPSAPGIALACTDCAGSISLLYCHCRDGAVHFHTGIEIGAQKITQKLCFVVRVCELGIQAGVRSIDATAVHGFQSLEVKGWGDGDCR